MLVWGSISLQKRVEVYAQRYWDNILNHLLSLNFTNMKEVNNAFCQTIMSDPIEHVETSDTGVVPYPKTILVIKIPIP